MIYGIFRKKTADAVIHYVRLTNDMFSGFVIAQNHRFYDCWNHLFCLYVYHEASVCYADQCNHWCNEYYSGFWSILD